MKFVLPDFLLKFLKKKNDNNIKMSDIILNNIFSNINFTREYFEILEKFNITNSMPKNIFYQIYHKENPFNKEQGLHSLNFIDRLTPDMIFKDKLYPNRKIYYLLNEYENIIYFKFIDKLLDSNISAEYSNKIIKLLEILEENEIKNLELNSNDYFTKKDIKNKFNDIKRFLKNFENKLEKELENYSIKSDILEYLKTNYNLDNKKVIKLLVEKNSFVAKKFNKLNQIIKNFDLETKSHIQIQYF